MAEKKFSKGDVVSVEAKVDFVFSDGAVDLEFAGGAEVSLAAEAMVTSNAKVVSRPAPAPPATGSVIRFTDTRSRYLVNAKGQLQRIYSDGSVASAQSWAATAGDVGGPTGWREFKVESTS